MLINEVYLFHTPISPSSCPTSTLLRHPSTPALLHTGVTLLKYSTREGCSLTQLPAQSWLNVLFPIPSISPVVSKLPREKEQRSGVYRMSVFKVTLCITHLFFFFKEKESTVFSLFFWWRKNNTKRSPVKGDQRAGGCGFPGTWTFCRRREKRGWSLPGGLIFFQLRGKIFLCRDSILLNSFYNVMIIKNKILVTSKPEGGIKYPLIFFPCSSWLMHVTAW